jgi:hypothetical protein
MGHLHLAEWLATSASQPAREEGAAGSSSSHAGKRMKLEEPTVEA